MYTFTTYDDQIAYLTEHPGEIPQQWFDAIGIFKFMGFPSGKSWMEGKVWAGFTDIGCVTTIHQDKRKYPYIDGIPNEELGSKIRTDTRIPDGSTNLTVEHLPIFKEYQEMVDNAQTKTESPSEEK